MNILDWKMVMNGWLVGMRSDEAETVAKELGIHYDFNESFWKYPETLYHATTDENADVIEREGIITMNKTRGISNRHIRSAIFCSKEIDEMESYGPVTFKIDTYRMKQNGITPFVAQEPDIEDHAIKDSIANKLGWQEFYMDIESGMDHNTVIVYGNIPAQYLSRV